MDDICYLVKETIDYDDYGRPVTKQTRRQVFCRASSITRSEFYAAAAANLNPEITLRLSDFMDYEGEHLVVFHGQPYSVIRTYQNSESTGNAIELILERKIGTMEAGDSE